MPNRVRVYRNINNGLLSIQAIDSGLILAHCQALQLQDAVFKVNEQGRLRVVQSRRKAVHAHVEGWLERVEGLIAYKGRAVPEMLTAPDSDMDGLSRTVRYNPYKWATFVDNHLQPVTQARKIIIQASGTMLATQA
ncbi:hypothetical protein [Pseudomonas sp. CFBP 13719]|uniref:hypothetical protein n=1 Tax=Pseudomonas sp. CFBP 13719 TaxID=2775303 RepID=UPI0017814BF3|nr:hypothetical protein [Pseudomonas sp. CFBP 13719]MBD8614939.1 hypothetical protein [Pseudomonas putida]MBD8681376.1 hypothetical protein [Pseudomonas sp. CFBP 13719]